MTTSTPLHLRLLALDLSFTRSMERVRFSDVTYFYGQMGAGKSSIARLIDFCLGGNLDLSPALQLHFVSAKLHLRVNGAPLAIERVPGSSNVRALWMQADERFEAILPARVAEGVKVPETEVEVLSDLVFHLAGMRPPRVRRSKVKEESALARLSLRDLLWYCYLDQDSIDSAFFHLEPEAHFPMRNKSRDVLRFVVGFHQERVAELESELQELQEKRRQYAAAAKSLQEALEASELASEEEIVTRIGEIEQEIAEATEHVERVRAGLAADGGLTHGVEALRQRAQALAHEIEALETAIPEVEEAIAGDTRYKNELLMLGIKANRAAAARAVLSGVDFSSCPRCAQTLPDREPDVCAVCGQEEPLDGSMNLSSEVLEADTKGRVVELEDAVSRHRLQLREMRRRWGEYVAVKRGIDSEITREMERYDSAFLSAVLVAERRRAALEQEAANLRRLIRLPRKVQELFALASQYEGEETDVRRRLNEAREAAEADQGNVRRLERLFLDCLVRARVPGISADARVEIRPPYFLPQVIAPETGDLAVTSFSNIHSGGKKTLFKACYALAIHRLAAEVGSALPTLLIIDSPMKNISERENEEQFVGFHELVYDLAAGELSETQFVLIDKEYSPPQHGQVEPLVRHMTPDDSDYPPLIPYYRGP